jgi:hypothetical protein
LRDKNKIVRIKETHNTNDTIERHFNEVYLTTFSEYLSKSFYKSYGHSIDLYPYKWYEIERLYEVPYFYFSSRQERFKNITANKTLLIKVVIRLASWTVSTVITFIITKYIFEKFL